MKNSCYEVLFDGRGAPSGFKFIDADLLDMPIKIVIGKKKLKVNKCEVKYRKRGESFDIEINELLNKVTHLSNSLLNASLSQTFFQKK